MNWWQTWGEPIVTVGAAGAAAVSAWYSRQAVRELAAFERRKLTLEQLDRHGTVAARTWDRLTRAELTVLHRLDWARHTENATMHGVVEYLNSGEMLAEAWRADALDSAMLLRYHANAGENYPTFRDILLPAYRRHVGQHNLYEAFESFLSACWAKLPKDRQAHALQVLADTGKTTDLVIGMLLPPEHPLRAFLLPEPPEPEGTVTRPTQTTPSRP